MTPFAPKAAGSPATPTEAVPDRSELERHVYAGQVELLYQNGPIAFIFTLICGAALAVVQQHEVPATLLWVWFGWLALLTTARMALAYRYARARPVAVAQARRWGNRYLIGLGLSGATWGVGVLFVFPADPYSQTFTAFVIAGIMSGASAVLAARVEAFLIFATPCLLPLAARYFLQGGELPTLLGIMVLVYFVAMLSTMRGVYRTIRTSLELAGDKRELLGEIVERQQMEQALRESDQRYDLAMKGAREGLWHWTATTKRFHISPHVSEILGFDPPLATLSVSEWLALIHPDDLTHFREAVRAYYRGDTEFFECELRVLRPDGTCRWVFNRGLGLRDSEGFIYRAAGSVGDITEQKRAAEEHERLTSQLRHAQKMEAVGTLAGGIAHEFNNLLGVILGYTEMARQSAPDDPRAAQYLKQVFVAGKRAKTIVNQILTFSRRGERARKAVDIQRLVSEAVELLRISLPSTIEIVERSSITGATVVADPDQLHQVLMNLGANAAQAMPQGGVLDIAVERVEMLQAVALAGVTLDAGPYVYLTVSDTGVGMDRATLERVFDPFFTTKEVGEGTGLGLSIVHGIVTDHGGAVYVDSQPDHGTTFHLYLPCSEDAADPDANTEQLVCFGQGQAILFVDDEPSLVELGEELLAALGYEPVGYTRSQEALAAFRANPERFQLVITDQIMPKLTGLDLAAELTRIRPDIPILLATGRPDLALAERGRLAGIREVLKKPLLIRELAEAIARVWAAERGKNEARAR
ncbi:MAG TPA: ATP-binding protein [Candidatus Competibacter sp.]|nr:ATP-binding protein [Candidatus Competibacter sp.]HUM95846.1 ATP-binding protein [Candidatus Competibacter sp.]